MTKQNWNRERDREATEKNLLTTIGQMIEENLFEKKLIILTYAFGLFLFCQDIQQAVFTDAKDEIPLLVITDSHIYA